MKIIGRVEVEAVTDVVCDICRCSTRTNIGAHQFGTLQAHWPVTLPMMGSAMNYIYVSIASSKHWLISSRSGELSIFSARMARISPIISVWSQMMFVSVTSGSIVGLFRDGGRRRRYLDHFLEVVTGQAQSFVVAR